MLDYANHGPYWRARETAHLEVLGVTADARGGGRYRPQYQQAPAYQPQYQAPAYQPPYQPAPVYQPRDSDGFVIRGGVRVRIN